jgi:integrase
LASQHSNEKITIDISVKELEEQYRKYLSDRSDTTVRPYLVNIRQFVSQYNEISIDNVKQYLTQFNNDYSYNNAVKALKHLGRMYDIELPIHVKPVHSEKLIIAPKIDTVLALLKGIRNKQVKAYLMLCATTGIRVTRLLNLNWSDIDLDNDFILRKVEHKRTKWYRPNPLHKDVRKLILKLDKTTDRVFPFTSKKISLAIEPTGIKITPTQLRDFFYNQALTCGMNTVIVEWFMGHDIGIAKHYLADNIKQEYTKFERTVQL